MGLGEGPEGVPDRPSEPQRRRQAAVAGYTGDQPSARVALADPSPRVRATALGALARMAAVTVADLEAGLADPAVGVRRRAAEVAGRTGAMGDVELTSALVLALGDDEPSVVEAAAWALGERGDARAVASLAVVVRGHGDALCREAAVAALGAIGDPSGLDTILAALGDRPPVRRRAVIALAPFGGSRVDEALLRASQDRDWQVRQAAEDLLRPPE